MYKALDEGDLRLFSILIERLAFEKKSLYRAKQLGEDDFADFMQWRITEDMLAVVIDQIRYNTLTVQYYGSDKKMPELEPFPRPGLKEKTYTEVKKTGVESFLGSLADMF